MVGVAGIEPATSCSQTKALSGRLTATPLLYFTGQLAEGQDKGHVRFEGLVHIGSVLPVTQVGPNGEPFGNYQFSASLMPLDDGRFPRDWIASRWDPAVPLEESLALAPSAWKRWVESGSVPTAALGSSFSVSPTGGGYALPADAALVDAVGMEAAMVEVRRAFPGEVVTRMPHNNPGYDIRVGSPNAPARYVEVKSTRGVEPAFLMSDWERRFSGTHSSVYSLLVVTGIDTDARTHRGLHWFEVEVDEDRFGLEAVLWKGRGPT